ncbi:hypothetical protein HK099_005803 [Clydaea vesicula]|uniref:Uncharacterized protein n=1 Tax=Clydaea vesicula TaxID=447962 RepID=A0AAD5U688_9FUNG|nr:hypothetical protein HK099_005803 [Clydaea vesicula]
MAIKRGPVKGLKTLLVEKISSLENEMKSQNKLIVNESNLNKTNLSIRDSYCNLPSDQCTIQNQAFSNGVSNLTFTPSTTYIPAADDNLLTAEENNLFISNSFNFFSNLTNIPESPQFYPNFDRTFSSNLQLLFPDPNINASTIDFEITQLRNRLIEQCKEEDFFNKIEGANAFPNYLLNAIAAIVSSKSTHPLLFTEKFGGPRNASRMWALKADEEVSNLDPTAENFTAETLQTILMLSIHFFESDEPRDSQKANHWMFEYFQIHETTTFHPLQNTTGVEDRRKVWASLMVLTTICSRPLIAQEDDLMWMTCTKSWTDLGIPLEDDGLLTYGAERISNTMEIMFLYRKVIRHIFMPTTGTSAGSSTMSLVLKAPSFLQLNNALLQWLQKTSSKYQSILDLSDFYDGVREIKFENWDLRKKNCRLTLIFLLALTMLHQNQQKKLNTFHSHNVDNNSACTQEEEHELETDTRETTTLLCNISLKEDAVKGNSFLMILLIIRAVASLIYVPKDVQLIYPQNYKKFFGNKIRNIL